MENDPIWESNICVAKVYEPRGLLINTGKDISQVHKCVMTQRRFLKTLETLKKLLMPTSLERVTPEFLQTPFI